MGGSLRESGYLRQRYRMILGYTGMVLSLCGGFMLFPLSVLPFYPGEAGQAWAFVLPGLSLALAGLMVWRWLRPRGTVDVSLQEGGVIVLLAWLGAALVSSIPFMIACRMSFTHAVFESVSGLTTTGLSLVDVTGASRMILLWRSTLQLVGGAGLAIIMLAAIVGPVGPAITSSEGREQLVPHVRQSARLVVVLYASYVLVGIVAYVLAGMGVFDAINHTFTAIATGGFSTRPESIGYWDSPAIEAVTVVLMLLGNLNFVTGWMLVRGRFSVVARNGEVRLMAVVIPASILALFWVTTSGLYLGGIKAVRVAVFECVSALTGTGFSTVTYAGWNGFGLMVLTFLMLLGGGTCSTSGAIKQLRVYLMWKALVWEVQRTLMPRHAVVQNAVWGAHGRVQIDDTRIRQVATYVFIYLLSYCIGSLIIAAHGHPMADALLEFASAQGTVGLSVGITHPGAPATLLWTETVGMFLGRLEFTMVFVAVAKIARDLNRMARSGE